MNVFRLTRTRTIDLMPAGFTYEEALDEAFRTGEVQVVDDETRRSAEVIELTQLGRVVNLFANRVDRGEN